jgi:type I restriction enzyme S subunit
LLRGQVGTQLPHITLRDIRSYRIALPPVHELRRIIAEAERQFSFIEACERAVDVGLARAAALRRSVLKAAFEGRLVRQDPSDEPASVLLDRIRASRAADTPKPARRRKAATG